MLSKHALGSYASVHMGKDTPNQPWEEQVGVPMMGLTVSYEGGSGAHGDACLALQMSWVMDNTTNQSCGMCWGCSGPLWLCVCPLMGWYISEVSLSKKSWFSPHPISVTKRLPQLSKGTVCCSLLLPKDALGSYACGP
jgi:hypothetical protein